MELKKMIKPALGAAVLGITLMVSAPAFAHSPLFDCFDNGDGTVTCEGGFSDGSSASGVAVHVKGVEGNVLKELKMNADSEVTFDKPTTGYMVEFDAGDGHSVGVNGADIVE
ncbi:MAG: hypothetical protein ACNI27_10425 [Desulfovibrio sp.]